MYFSTSTFTFQTQCVLFNVTLSSTSNNNSGCQIDKDKPRWRSTRPSNISNNNNISITVQTLKVKGFFTASPGEAQMKRDPCYDFHCQMMRIKLSGFPPYPCRIKLFRYQQRRGGKCYPPFSLSTATRRYMFSAFFRYPPRRRGKWSKGTKCVSK